MMCDFCSSEVTKDFFGTIMCESCADEIEIICTECGGTEFIHGDEGPAMCVDCRSIDSETDVDWEDGMEVEY